MLLEMRFEGRLSRRHRSCNISWIYCTCTSASQCSVCRLRSGPSPPRAPHSSEICALILSEHLNWLFEASALNENLPRCFTVFLRTGGDFGHTARWTVNKLPFYVETASLVFDGAVFVAETRAAVSECLIWLLARESDTLQSVQYYAPRLAEQLLTLAQPIVLYQPDGSVAHEVDIKVRCSLRLLFNSCAVVGAMW